MRRRYVYWICLGLTSVALGHGCSCDDGGGGGGGDEGALGEGEGEAGAGPGGGPNGEAPVGEGEGEGDEGAAPAGEGPGEEGPGEEGPGEAGGEDGGEGEGELAPTEYTKLFWRFIGLLPPAEGAGWLEAWVTVDGRPVSAGRFTLDANQVYDVHGRPLGHPLEGVEFLAAGDARAATEAFVTLEPLDDPAPRSPGRTLLRGGQDPQDPGVFRADVSGAVADFSEVQGAFTLMAGAQPAPPDGGEGEGEADPGGEGGEGEGEGEQGPQRDPVAERQGIWFVQHDEPDAAPSAGLTLPALPEGWRYEGWVEDARTPDLAIFHWTTGRFARAFGMDADQEEDGDAPDALNFPGEDFRGHPVLDPGGDDDLPLNFASEGWKVMVTLEPEPDPYPGPSQFRLLRATVGPQIRPVAQPLNSQAHLLPEARAWVGPLCPAPPPCECPDPNLLPPDPDPGLGGEGEGEEALNVPPHGAEAGGEGEGEGEIERDPCFIELYCDCPAPDPIPGPGGEGEGEGEGEAQ